MANQFLILGVDEAATPEAIDEAFRYLGTNLNPKNLQADSVTEQQAQLCLAKIVPAYQLLKDPLTRDKCRAEALAESQKPFNPDDFKPFLGHICVAAGIITIEDLNEAISKQSDIDLPLGQILQEKQLLSQTELDGLLMGQRLFGSPTRPLDPFTQRMLALGVISRDMVKIVLIDQRTAYGATLEDLLLKRGWVAERIAQVLNDQQATTSPN